MIFFMVSFTYVRIPLANVIENLLNGESGGNVGEILLTDNLCALARVVTISWLAIRAQCRLPGHLPQL